MGKTTSEKKKNNKWKILITVLLCVFISVSSLLLFAANWYVVVYGNIGFSAILYTLTNSLGGVQSGLIYSYLLNGLLPAVLVSVAICLLLFLNIKKGLFVKLFKKRVRLFPIKRQVSVCLAIILPVCFMLTAGSKTGFFEFLKFNFQSTQIYEDYYVDPSEADIVFPEQKRNLVYIYLESMETTYLSQDLGGAVEYNLIPELYDLATENVNFSHNNDVGGFRVIDSASWTMGSIVAQSSGIPLKIPLDPNNYSAWNDNFIAYSDNITDVLSNNGYNQVVMYGSDASFAGRDAYYKQHSVENILDIFTARKDGIVPEDYYVWWGMEDKHLFEYAKQVITELSKEEKPFAFTTLTVDTHHIGGYVCENCENNYNEQYENVISCSSKQVYEFVEWLKQQPFYDNTVIVITGDHLTMDNNYISNNVDSGYIRHVYNCFINSDVVPVKTQNREFCAIDMYPTTLAALGCKFSGDRLALGTNLFSNTPTLIEELGYNEFRNETLKNSDFYQVKFTNQ